MGTILSDGFSNSVIKQKLSVKTSRDAIFIITLVDLVLIVPSVVLFSLLNFRELSSYGLVFSIVVLAFLSYLPLSIIWASMVLSGKRVDGRASVTNEKVVPIVLFLLLTFSMLGIYIPSIQKLTSIMPSFGALNIVGFTIIVLNLMFVMKNFSLITGN
ncbi:MAG: hypothetical protein AMDU3_IPLC00001G0412 [Thermoplasmatales archaeon I-plasma]|jgi:hypothetical protein|nr:MAG: hypothetical protein AMDU3_IPLC00001G0412 [Thermoplasmatales archaeon I-plasma]MCL5929761.1 hypothetical protein [Candidatus Thermoplasmatota archaeon]